MTVYTFPIQFLKPFNSDPMPRVGRRFYVGTKIVKIIDVRVSDLVFDVVVV